MSAQVSMARNAKFRVISQIMNLLLTKNVFLRDVIMFLTNVWTLESWYLLIIRRSIEKYIRYVGTLFPPARIRWIFFLNRSLHIGCLNGGWVKKFTDDSDCWCTGTPFMGDIVKTIVTNLGRQFLRTAYPGLAIFHHHVSIFPGQISLLTHVKITVFSFTIKKMGLVHATVQVFSDRYVSKNAPWNVLKTENLLLLSVFIKIKKHYFLIFFYFCSSMLHSLS